MKSEHKRQAHAIMRFPRLPNSLLGIPRLDLSEVKDSRPLIDDFVMEGTTQVGYGKFGTRKTTIHLLAAWCVSQGIPFLGKKTRKRMILYLDYENPAGVLKAFCQDLGMDPDDPCFTIWKRTKEEPPLPGDEILEKFIRRCKRDTGHYPWIIFDSWTSLLRSGESGNEIGEATPIFRAIRKYCDLGATCTIIDHTGKRGGHEPIGTSAKMTQMDTAHQFKVEKVTFGPDMRSSRMVLSIENFLKRFAPEGVGALTIEIKAAMDDKGVWHTTSIEPTTNPPAPDARLRPLAKYMKKNPGTSARQIAIEHPEWGSHVTVGKLLMKLKRR